MADPFRHLLNPNQQGTIMGFLGGLTGQESPQERAGGARARAMKHFSELIGQGKNPQQALVEFMQSPDGVEMFTSDPDLLKTLTEFQTAIKPPDAKITTAPAGSQIYSTDPRTQQTSQVGSNPTADVQTFKYLTDVAQLSHDELKELAKMTATPAEGRRSPAERAVAALVSSGRINADTGNKLIAGALELKETKDLYGNASGQYILIDKTDNTAVPLNRGAGTSAPIRQTPDNSNPDGTINPQKVFSDKRKMFLGTGLPANIVSMASQVLQQIDPSLITNKGAEIATQQNDLNALRNSLISIRDGAAGLGIPKIMIEGLLNLAPRPGALLESPHDAVLKGIQLNDKVIDEIQANEATIRDPMVSKEEKSNASKRMVSWQRVLRTLPPRESMVELEGAIRGGTAGAVGAREAAGAVGDMLRRGGSEARTPGAGVKMGDKSDIASMPMQQLLLIDPKDVPPNQRAVYKKRLQTGK